MQGKDIYVGTIKKCKDLYNYKKHGDEHFIGDFRIGHCVSGRVHENACVVKENAVLIKMGESSYIWLDLLTNKFEELLVNLGASIHIVETTPSFEGDWFVDEKTLQPAFKDNKNNLTVKKVKSLVRPLTK